MDPASIIGIAGALLGMIDVCTRSLNALLNLRTRYQQAELAIRLLLTQLSTLKAATFQISEWITTSLHVLPPYLQADLNISLSGCKVLLEALSNFLTTSDDGDDTLNIWRKSQFLWEESDRLNFQTNLNHQVAALHLFLTAIQCRSQTEQINLLQQLESRRIIESVRDGSSSLLWLRDDESICTQKTTATDTSEFLDTSFTFDREVFNSRAYQVAIRSNMKQAVRGTNTIIRSAETSHKFLIDAHGIAGGDDGQTVKLPSPRLLSQRGNSQSKNIVDLTTDEEDLACTELKEVQQILSNDHSTVIEEHQNEGSDITICSSKSYIASGESKEAKVQGLRKGFHIPKLLKSRSTSSASSLITLDQERASGRKRSLAHDAVKILLIGGSTGTRSTLLRSMKLAYGDCYTHDEKVQFKVPIFNDSIRSMLTILESMKASQVQLYDVDNEAHVRNLFMQSIPVQTNTLPQTTTAALNALWHDTFVINYIEQHMHCQPLDSILYNFQCLPRIAGPDYMPSIEDISRCFVEENGIRETHISRKSAGIRYHYRIFEFYKFSFEPRKWVHAFEDTSIMIYLVDVNSYFLPLTERGLRSDLRGDSAHFLDICNSKALARKPVLLLFHDIGIPVRNDHFGARGEYFPDYAEDLADIGALKIYIRDSFVCPARESTLDIRSEYTTDTLGTTLGTSIVGLIDEMITRGALLHFGNK